MRLTLFALALVALMGVSYGAGRQAEILRMHRQAMAFDRIAR